MSWAKGSWGAWHTGPDASPCPQDGQWHSIAEAVTLNDRDREFKQATMHARHKAWLGKENGR